MNPSDAYREAFIKFLSEGMTHSEAYGQFDEGELQAAVDAELGITDDEGETDPLVLWKRQQEKHNENSLFHLCVKANFERRQQKNFEEQAVPLMMAGWTMEIPDSHKHNSNDFWRQGQVMSLYWRAPSKRAGKPGRKYLSTNQSFNAMMRPQEDPPGKPKC